MSKVYKGYELYKMIAERKIENGTNFIDENGQKWTFDGKQMIWEEHDYNDFEFSITDFELIEEDEAIDIDNIEELTTGYSESGADTDIINYINDKIVPSIKQLDKEIKELKSLDIEISEKDINEAIKNAREQLNKEKSIKEK